MRTETPESGESNEVHGDAAEQSVKPQLADMQLTTSVALFLNRGSLSDCVRCKVNSDVRGSWTQRDAEETCAFGKVSPACEEMLKHAAETL